MTTETPPSPAKRLERQSRSSLDGFKKIELLYLEQVIPEVAAEMREVGIAEDLHRMDEDDHKIELLARNDPDGVELLLGAIAFDDGMLSGVITQTQDKRFIGRTTFANAQYGGEKVIHIGSTNTWGQGREGLGEQRMRILNEYVKSRFGRTLCSVGRSDSAKGLWNSLLGRGLAKQTALKDGTPVYSML